MVPYPEDKEDWEAETEEAGGQWAAVVWVAGMAAVQAAIVVKAAKAVTQAEVVARARAQLRIACGGGQ